MARDQKIRAVLFYTSVLTFWAGLPLILAFALNYTFNPKTLRFTKTGLISIKTQPSGAGIYLDGRMLEEKTPHTINELLPGAYSLEVKLPGFYPYSASVSVGAGKVSRLEKIILFPVRQNVQRLNREAAEFFWIDEQRGAVYYINGSSVYKADYDCVHAEESVPFVPLSPVQKRWELSYDREKLLYFNSRQIGIVLLHPYPGQPREEVQFVLDFPSESIHEVFWHSDNYHIVVVCNRKIVITEARKGALPLNLVSLNARGSRVFYDGKNDTLFFSDLEEASDGNAYTNLYKLELNQKLYPFQFQEFIRLKAREQLQQFQEQRTNKNDEKK